MKKVFVLIVLFALPISVYILFASAVNHFKHLPILTEQVDNLNNFTSLEGDTIELNKKITLLSFYGKSIHSMRGNAFNLNEKIYTDNQVYREFQCVVLAEDGTQDQARQLLKDLHSFSGLDVSKWKFAFGSLEDIQQVFDDLHTDVKLNDKYASPFVFLIDQEMNLRGRKKDDPPFKSPTLYGYDTRSVAVLDNTLVDDLKILLIEYQLKKKDKERDFTKYKK